MLRALTPLPTNYRCRGCHRTPAPTHYYAHFSTLCWCDAFQVPLPLNLSPAFLAFRPTLIATTTGRSPLPIRRQNAGCSTTGIPAATWTLYVWTVRGRSRLSTRLVRARDCRYRTAFSRSTLRVGPAACHVHLRVHCLPLPHAPAVTAACATFLSDGAAFLMGGQRTFVSWTSCNNIPMLHILTLGLSTTSLRLDWFAYLRLRCATPSHHRPAWPITFRRAMRSCVDTAALLANAGSYCVSGGCD